MGWKELLMPDWRRLVIFIPIVIFKLYVVISVLGYMECAVFPMIKGSEAELRVYNETLYNDFLSVNDKLKAENGIFYYFINCQSSDYRSAFGPFSQNQSALFVIFLIFLFPFSLSGIIFSLIIWYIFSCILVSLYDMKFKKSKTRK